MPKNTPRLEYLLERFEANNLTRAEFDELLLLASDEENENFIKELWAADLQTSHAGTYDREHWDQVFRRLKLKQAPVRKLHLWKYIAAASIILVLAVGTYFFLSKKNEQPSIATKPAPVQNDIAPGRQGAILTLSNGKQIILDSTIGTIANEAGVAVNNNNGSVIYNQPQTNPDSYRDKPETVYNTMSTPKGRQYALVLSDGTKVWLNAASSITYPTAFSGKEREVEITGEAYFEVAHDASKPFKVKKGETEVLVLGTHFNVNTYEDEDAIRVTLLEGSVKVSRLTSHDSRVIKPGEQVVAKDNSPLTIDHSPDVDAVMAWKNGKFDFQSADIQTIMRQVSRWYDVDIVYEGTVPQRNFTGKVDRNVNVSQVLKILELSKIHFRIEGKKIIVTP